MPLLTLGACATAAPADEGAFTKGQVFTDYGPAADVDVTMPIPPGTAFKHSFDVSTSAPDGSANSTPVSADWNGGETAEQSAK